MKLELKHLAPYLPYGLKYEYNGKLYLMSVTIGDLTIGYDDNQGAWHSLCNCKPILRPLSDLTKDEKIIDLLAGDRNNFDKSVEITRIELVISTDYTLLNVCDYQTLLEHHFDVFGLIEKGLAIDINTINPQ